MAAICLNKQTNAETTYMLDSILVILKALLILWYQPDSSFFSEDGLPLSLGNLRQHFWYIKILKTFGSQFSQTVTSQRLATFHIFFFFNLIFCILFHLYCNFFPLPFSPLITPFPQQSPCCHSMYHSWSLVPIQCQQEPQIWGVVKKETSFSAKLLNCGVARLWAGPGAGQPYPGQIWPALLLAGLLCSVCYRSALPCVDLL